MRIKRRFMDRSNLDIVLSSRLIKKNSKFFGNNCVVGLFCFDKVTDPVVLNNNFGNYTVIGDGYRWLQVALENENYWITAMFDNDDNLVQIYCDVTDGNVLDDNPYFDDLFIDVVLFDNEVFMIDQDDLINAYREGIISTLQYNKAKVTSLRLFDFIKDNKKEIVDYCYKMLKEMEVLQMHNIVFRSDNLDFVNVTMDFIDDYLLMINDPIIQDFISIKGKTYSYDGEVEWIRSTLENNRPIYSIVERNTGKFVGNIGFNSIIDGVGTLGICITPCYQDRGYGTEAIKGIVEYGFNELGINEIILDVFSSNPRAIHCYKKLGFVEYKVEENIKKVDGVSVDNIHMRKVR